MERQPRWCPGPLALWPSSERCQSCQWLPLRPLHAARSMLYTPATAEYVNTPLPAPSIFPALSLVARQRLTTAVRLLFTNHYVVADHSQSASMSCAELVRELMDLRDYGLDIGEARQPVGNMVQDLCLSRTVKGQRAEVSMGEGPRHTSLAYLHTLSCGSPNRNQCAECSMPSNAACISCRSDLRPSRTIWYRPDQWHTRGSPFRLWSISRS